MPLPMLLPLPPALLSPATSKSYAVMDGSMLDARASPGDGVEAAAPENEDGWTATLTDGADGSDGGGCSMSVGQARRDCSVCPATVSMKLKVLFVCGALRRY